LERYPFLPPAKKIQAESPVRQSRMRPEKHDAEAFPSFTSVFEKQVALVLIIAVK
jgi:hypothetical protein